MVVTLHRPTSDTFQLAHAALLGLQCIYRKGFDYAKAGVMLMKLQIDAIQQQELDLENKDCPGNSD